MNAQIQPNPCFNLGQLVFTPGARDALAQLNISPFNLLSRHQRGDWGDLDKADCEANQEALQTGRRLFSAYIIQDVKFWVITEAQDDQGYRMATTILLPEEY